MAELKKCPFCGGEATVKRHHNRYSDWWLVSCSKCGISQTGNAHEFSFEAIEAWNNRATEAEIREKAYADFVEHITLPLTTEEDIAQILEQLKEE